MGAILESLGVNISIFSIEKLKKFLILTIHQPTFLPYPGFFHKLTLADTFVVLDNTQFNYDETNRNKIISNADTWTRISIPIKNKHKFLPINPETPVIIIFSLGTFRYQHHLVLTLSLQIYL